MSLRPASRSGQRKAVDRHLALLDGLDLDDVARTVKLENAEGLGGVVVADASVRARRSDVDNQRYGLIVADNVVRDGTLADPESEDQKVQAQRRLHEMVAAGHRVSGTTIQTVGGKGYDGFMVALVEK